MHDCIEKFQNILEKDLKAKLEKVNAAGTVNPDDLMVIDKATDVMLDLIKYDEWKMGEGENSYDMGYSNRRGRSMTTGRYVSRDPYPTRSYGEPSINGYSMNRYYDDSYMRGYSGHGSLEDELSRLYMNSKDEHERSMIKNFMDTVAMSR